MRKHSTDLQDAVMKTVTDNFTINHYPAKVENMVSY